MFPSYNPHNSFNALGSGGMSYSDYGGYGGGGYGMGSGYGGYGGYGSSMYGLGGSGYGGYGSGMYGTGMGMGGMSGNPILQGFENYLMTTSRVSNLIQMSMQGVSMTVQSAFQLAQSGMMLQQQHANLNQNSQNEQNSGQTSPNAAIEYNPDGSIRKTRGSDNNTGAKVEEITDDTKTDNNNNNTTHTHQLTTITSPQTSMINRSSQNEIPSRVFDPQILHNDLQIFKLPWFLSKLFSFLDYLESFLTPLPSPPKLIRLFSITIIDTIINFTRRVEYLYNFSNSKNFNSTTLYSYYLQYRLFLQTHSNICTPAIDIDTDIIKRKTPNQSKSDQDDQSNQNDQNNDRKDDLFDLYEVDDIRMLVIHSLVARHYTDMTKELIVEQYKTKIDPNNQNPSQNGQNSPVQNTTTQTTTPLASLASHPIDGPDKSIKSKDPAGSNAQNSLKNSSKSPISPIVSSLLANHRHYYSIQSQQLTQNDKLQTAGYQIMQSTTPSKLWWFVGIFLAGLGIQTTISLLRSLHDLLAFLFPSMFSRSNRYGSNPNRPIAVSKDLSQNELYQRWQLLSQNGQQSTPFDNIPPELAALHQKATAPKSFDEIWSMGGGGSGGNGGGTMMMGMPQQQQPQLPGFLPNTPPHLQSDPTAMLNNMTSAPGIDGIGGMNGQLNGHNSLLSNNNQNRLLQQQQQQQQQQQFQNGMDQYGNNNMMGMNDPYGNNTIGGMNGLGSNYNSLNPYNNNTGMNGGYGYNSNPNGMQNGLFGQQGQGQMMVEAPSTWQIWGQRLSTLITTGLVCGTGWVVYKAFVIANNEMKRYQAAQKEQQQQQLAQQKKIEEAQKNTDGNGQNSQNSTNNNQQIPLYSVDNPQNNMNTMRLSNGFGSNGMGGMNTLGGGMGGMGGMNMGMNSMNPFGTGFGNSLGSTGFGSSFGSPMGGYGGMNTMGMGGGGGMFY